MAAQRRGIQRDGGAAILILVALHVLFRREALCWAGFSSIIDEITVLANSAGRMPDCVGSVRRTEHGP